MSTRERPGRNEPCPCGSGKKFKVCCEGRQDVQGSRRSTWLIGGLAVVGLAAVATAVLRLDQPAPTPLSQPLQPPASRPISSLPAPIVTMPGSPEGIKLERVPPPGQPGQQPPGPAPAGKVWSPEHGHYHDAPAGAVAQGPNGAIPPVPLGTPGTLTPEPPGPVPEGKVWSAEHGHYHDLPAAVPPGATPANGVVTPAPQPVEPGVITPQPVVPPAPPPETPGPK